MVVAPQKVLVTGGHGFLGSHVARRLVQLGHSVTVTDIIDRSRSQNFPSALESVIGDLRDPDFCGRVVQGAAIIMHFAANMGGMGTIHADNELEIYEDNHTMLLNVLRASSNTGVKKFLFASSACVYPDSLQQVGDKDVLLAEDDVWRNPPPHPQGLYGLEKLCSELVLQLSQAERDIPMQTFIARFHNIYGPFGSWRDGREKVPAALLRKVLAAKHSGTNPIPLEIWGEGNQRRSFCFIDDAVDGILKLLDSACHHPVNIGSDRAVSVDELARIAANAVGIDPSTLILNHIPGPVGVGSRNSDNTFVHEQLGWAPTVSLEEGMRRTGTWIESQLLELLDATPDDKKARLLQELLTSKILRLRSRGKCFAIILPVTSRTGQPQEPSKPPPCLESLRAFARSILATTHHDTLPRDGSPLFSFRVYLAVDDDDSALWNKNMNLAEEVLRMEGISDIVTLRCHFPRGRVCSLWRFCARKAWQDGCEYFVLMGDDVTLHTDKWMSTVHNEFLSIAAERKVPQGFGCVAFTDTTFPGMPTFPIIHRTHLNIFHGQVVPDVFVNQDGDPFLYQLYRRFGCSTTVNCKLRNALGGGGTARYEKLHAKEWTLGPLSEATSVVEQWLGSSVTSARMLTLDVIIPCYRVQMPYLNRFLALRASRTCTVMFIIIIDDPQSPTIQELQDKHGHRMDVRIRTNNQNLGASASRNRGLSESAAEWVLFLDDDVEPEDNLLVEMEHAIRASPKAAGFVGNARFPIATTVFTSAVHLAGVTYFWDIADKIERDVPWGVTANLAARRDINDGVVYDLAFPKTGGGEDIDYCRKKRQYALAHEGEGFVAAPRVVVTHPYWNNGRRSYWRFYMWSKGDGALVKLYPELTYVDFVPNSAEVLLLSLTYLVGSLSLYISSATSASHVFLGFKVIGATILANLLHDAYRHLWRDAERTQSIKTTVRGLYWALAVLESSFIRIFSEWGRVVGLLERGQVGLLMRRFDWFAGVWGEGPRNEERKNNLQRVALTVLLIAVVVS